MSQEQNEGHEETGEENVAPVAKPAGKRHVLNAEPGSYNIEFSDVGFKLNTDRDHILETLNELLELEQKRRKDSLAEHLRIQNLQKIVMSQGARDQAEEAEDAKRHLQIIIRHNASEINRLTIAIAEHQRHMNSGSDQRWQWIRINWIAILAIVFSVASWLFALFSNSGANPPSP